MLRKAFRAQGWLERAPMQLTRTSTALEAPFHYTDPKLSQSIFNNCFPMFFPVNNRVSVAGMFLKPSWISS